MKSLLSFGEQIKTEDAQLIILCNDATSVTAVKGSTKKVGYGYKDTFYLIDLTTGTWNITATDGIRSTSKSINITNTTYMQVVYMYLNHIPDFSYSGTYEVLNDDDVQISNTSGDWKIRFLTSGILRFNNLRGMESGIDVFLVGGGGGGGAGNNSAGGGGGGGYTKTMKNVPIETDIDYAVTIGSGGINGAINKTNGGDGGSTTAFNISISGGKGGGGINKSNNMHGGAGGSGGAEYSEGYGGSNGSNGAGTHGGKGQGTTTREFGESNGRLYSSGGSGGKYVGANLQNGYGPIDEIAGAPSITPPDNRGGGGGGSNHSNQYNSTNGGSGIVVIRNARS